MSSFLYFTDELDKSPTMENIVGMGLGYAFDKRPAFAEIKGRTPTGAKGWLFADGERLGDGKFGYSEESQKWRKIPGTNVHVGFNLDCRPSPESLKRPETLAGELVRLADGNQWLLPRLRFWAGEEGYQSALPWKADLDENGNWIAGETLESSSGLDALSDRLYSGMVLSLLEGSKHKPLTTEEMLNAAAELLSVNHFVSKLEVVMLGLLTNDNSLDRIACVATDFDTALEWTAKKNEASQSAASAG